MNSGIAEALGGLGVFLLGMVVMTSGLKSLAGNALRNALARFTRSPLSGAISGALATAIIQSSSATTVTAVGFVGAGLITFSQALGIIFGANIGTTVTGWLVAILGFKIKIGGLALPLVLVGMLMNLFAKARWSWAGYALAGFGLIFVGIDLIQQGMAGLNEYVTPASFPDDTLMGRLLLVLIGVGVTVVTQSSSAGMATALVAVHAGTITFPQAAAMVIGMDVGTTATAALATIGGTTDVRRTGFSHVIYNLLTGCMAFLLLNPYTQICLHWAPQWFEQNPEIALVAFHTLFNTLGVIAVLPFTGGFAKLMMRLVPEQPHRFTQRLDRSLYESPEIALQAVQGTLQELSQVVITELVSILKQGPTDLTRSRLQDANQALKHTREYLTPIQATEAHESIYFKKLSAIHTLDHLRRLIDRCQNFKRAQRARTEPELAALSQRLLSGAEQALVALTPTAHPPPEVPFQEQVDRLHQVWRDFDSHAEQDRQHLIGQAAAGQLAAHPTIQKLDSLRWIRRVSYHLWRILGHLQDASVAANADRSNFGKWDMADEADPT